MQGLVLPKVARLRSVRPEWGEIAAGREERGPVYVKLARAIAVEFAETITKFHPGASGQFVFELFDVTLLRGGSHAVSLSFDDLGPRPSWISEDYSGHTLLEHPLLQGPFSTSVTRSCAEDLDPVRLRKVHS